MLWPIYTGVAVVLTTVRTANTCESDPIDAMFYASELGRATNFFIKNCSHYLKELKPNPPIELVYKFVRSVCEKIDLCRERFQERSFQENVPCLEDELRAKWIPLQPVPLEQIEMTERMMRGQLCLGVYRPWFYRVTFCDCEPLQGCRDGGARSADEYLGLV
ncbi:uncharacterized protein LOC144164828 [Haemaphysalis longicornis]